MIKLIETTTDHPRENLRCAACVAEVLQAGQNAKVPLQKSLPLQCFWSADKFYSNQVDSKRFPPLHCPMTVHLSKQKKQKKNQAKDQQKNKIIKSDGLLLFFSANTYIGVYREPLVYHLRFWDFELLAWWPIGNTKKSLQNENFMRDPIWLGSRNAV